MCTQVDPSKNVKSHKHALIKNFKEVYIRSLEHEILLIIFNIESIPFQNLNTEEEKTHSPTILKLI